MREIPIPVYLSWPTPDYEHPQTRGSALLIVNIVFIIIVTSVVTLRLYSRMLIKNKYGWDDLMIVLAFLCTVGMTTVVLLANRHYGWDRHTWDVKPSMFQNANIIAFVAKQMFTFAVTFTRLALLLFYYRLIKDSGIKWYRWVLHASFAFMIAVCITFIFLGVFICVPVQAYWVFPAISGARCLNEGKATLAAGVVNCMADFIATCVPIPLIMRLQMPLRQRIGACVLLSGGLLVTVAGIVRTYYIWKGLISSYDESWFTYPLWLSAALEVDIGVICACMPSVKAVLWPHIQDWSNKIYSKVSYANTKSSPETISLSSQEPINSGTSTRMEFKSDRAPRLSMTFTHLDDVEKGTPTIIAAYPAENPSHAEAYPMPLERPQPRQQDSPDLRRAHHRKRTEEWEISKVTSYTVSASSSPERSVEALESSSPAAHQPPCRPRHQPIEIRA